MARQFRLDRLEMPDIEALEPKLRARVMRQGLRVVALRVREIVPRRSGRLRKAVRYSVMRGGYQGKIKGGTPGAPHGHLVHDGTKPHMIKPRTPESARRGWRIYPGGRAIRHPGARANPFLLIAAEETRGEVERVMHQAGEQALAEIAEGR